MVFPPIHLGLLGKKSDFSCCLFEVVLTERREDCVPVADGVPSDLDVIPCNFADAGGDMWA